MHRLGLSVEQAFDPCGNLKAMQTIYLGCYAKAGEAGYGNRMQRALSCYNTGNITKGFSNGYVNKVTNNFNAFAGGAKIIYQQYPQKRKPILTKLPNPKIVISMTAKVVKNTKVDVPPQAETQLPLKVHSTWDVFKDY